MKHHFDQYKFKLLKSSSGPTKDPLHYDPTLFVMRLNQLRKETDEQHKTLPPGSFRPVVDEDVINVVTIANAEHALWRGKGLHTFIDPDTENVIEKSISKLTNGALSRYRPVNDIGILYRAGKEPVMYNYASENGVGASINVESMGIFRMDDLGVLKDIEEGEDPNIAKLRESMRFVSGCFMMQECFPEIFRKGVPDYVKHPNWFKQLNARSISVDRVDQKKCPHIRSGHFRLLSSDRYVHKKGQIVFVKASMINGKATHTKSETLKGENHD